MACAGMIAIGFGEIIGSLVNGYLHDNLGTKRFAICNIVEVIIAYILLIAYTAHATYNVVFASFFTFFWGF
jgi:predicted MFS family arabinose efflux permease